MDQQIVNQTLPTAAFPAASDKPNGGYSSLRTIPARLVQRAALLAVRKSLVPGAMRCRCRAPQLEVSRASHLILALALRSGDNNFMLNGVDANSYSSNMTEVTPLGGAGIAIPAPDTIQEFKVRTSLYDAQYGRGGGANVNVETRSGTADLHGNVYYFGRNEALDANNFFANATRVPRGEFRRLQPGHQPGSLSRGVSRVLAIHSLRAM